LGFVRFGSPYSWNTVKMSLRSSKSLRNRIHSMLEKSLIMLEFGIKTSRPLKVLENG